MGEVPLDMTARREETRLAETAGVVGRSVRVGTRGGG